MEIDVQRARRESLRWTILLSLDKARPLGASEYLVLSVAQAIYADATQLEIRREISYLQDREMVHVNKEPSGQWLCSLTRHGVDLAEYTTPCQPGIARPEKYW